ncbi:MAG: DNA adenine methylase [Limisphaerales bacterium]
MASVPQRSPFRYPGGKTWLVPLFRRWMMNLPSQPKILVEPFAGGGIISLTSAFEWLTDKVVMVELDNQIAAVWETILGGDAKWLAKRLLTFELTPESAKDELAKPARSQRELAFQTILRNRTAHGGILAEGAGVLKNGENGKGILSRWYPETIGRRITNIELVAKRLEFIHGDAFEILNKYQKDEDAVFFIDPPYTAGGKNAGSRLYTHSVVDHEKLFSLCEKLNGDFLMTYDNAEEVQSLAEKHGFQTKPVAMKNTHHAEMDELLIGRNLDWVEEGGIFRENSPEYKTSSENSIRVKNKEPQHIDNFKLTPTGYGVKKSNMSDKRIYVEQRPEGDYAVRKPGSDRASAVEPTQAKAIERARELNPGVAPHVERVRDTNVGGRDKWRKP